MTLTGTGGTGKTRLALEVAAASLLDFADGVFFVDLAPIEDDGLVASAIASALRLREYAGEVIDVVVDHLREKNLLLVLDNFEQVVQSAACCRPGATWRSGREGARHQPRAFGPYGEQQFHVPPLGLPDLDHLPEVPALAQLDAVALFVQRAPAAQAGFLLTAENAGAVAEITPASTVSRSPSSSPPAASSSCLLQRLLARLEARLPFFTAAEPQRAGAAADAARTIDWSHDLLLGSTAALRPPAVFAGGGDLDAVEAVVNPGGSSVTPSTLLLHLSRSIWSGLSTRPGESRFGMLETIREYGLERLFEPARSRPSAAAMPSTGPMSPSRLPTALSGPTRRGGAVSSSSSTTTFALP